LQERQFRMKVSIRRFEKRDITNKVSWINDPLNNAFLHYDLPLEVEKTEAWFERNKDATSRYDAVIEADGIPVGLIGLLSIDYKNQKAEYYVLLGERAYLGKGIAGRATVQLLKYAFEDMLLNRVYLYTETENASAVKLYERIGFKREGIIKDDLFNKGRYIDRYIYGITKRDFYHQLNTPIHSVIINHANNLYIKREDFIPFSFGGNKARKAKLFFEQIERGNFDCVVTYGSSSSNHCRIIANMAVERKMPCYIISPEEASEETYNRDLMGFFGAEFTVCPVEHVHDAIEAKIAELKEQGFSPYFIMGGGHGNIGTQAYVDCYKEIRDYEKENNIRFDYIFHASGTGTTQAGLICGQLIHRDNRKIIGISIARKNPRGRSVVVESIRDYFNEHGIAMPPELIEDATVFVDDYVGAGYGARMQAVNDLIQNAMVQYGLPLDATYTGKAFAGMMDYIEKHSIQNKNILFIHTGGTPLFFDYLNNELLDRSANRAYEYIDSERRHQK